ncbi:lipase 1 precursor [Purpureocillium lilacinum]|uniref:Lipase 1 n=1 Tax=Purpureocillium lilacinum TaxID=33203 RepID=A0A179GL15_PURLI|nr:lipase 1 precursor [Purpureocillium lilacinum]OAQ77799.1 lipase 1 precursor [Purpureocillium lilacinum]OAQ85194.1 lipase 1 precursor [Purpureocillium lilacinum]PWI65649.1 hypothetical protein PCL_06854 [Purpureocillium lilacinum]GJN74773.1 hypothetical protein PLICBS_008866 [Purpureocillium lilacinum]
MVFLSSVLVAAAALTGAASASSYPRFSSLEPRATSEKGPIAPKQDPWYTAPPSFASGEPGQILRIRPAPGNLTKVVANCSAAYNILYRTTDSHYKPTWAVTTLFVPKTANGTASSSWGKALLSYQIPYDSADVDASPSYALYKNPPGDIATALGRSWFVSVPDYEGPLGSFTAGVMSGHATLDSVRAVRAASFGLLPDARYAMWGYSGGALASEWAAELAVQYAPELQFAGAALGGLTPNVTSVMLTLEGSIGVGLVPSGILGLASQYPELRKYIEDNLKTDGKFNKTGFLAAENYTLAESAVAYANHNISDYFKNGFDLIYSPVAQRVINSDGQMGYHGVPQMPLYVYKAVQDEISPANETDALVEKYCTVGATISYVRNAAGSHTTEFVNGLAGASKFLQSVLAGNYNSTGCTTKNVNISLVDNSLQRRDLHLLW